MAVLASDDFDRANSADLGANWDVHTAGREFSIVSNECALPSQLDRQESYNAVVMPQDHYASIVMGTVPASGLGAGFGPGVRFAAPTARTYYRLCGSGGGWGLKKIVAGVVTDLAENTTPTFTTGDVLRLEASGTTPTSLVMKKNGVQFATASDPSSTLLGTRAGIAYSSSGAASAQSWEAGSLDVAGDIPGSRIYVMP